MKRLLFIVLVSIVLVLPALAQNKAILIGISEYQPGSGWRSINANNDVILLKNKLEPKWDVKVLENKDATHDGIIRLLEKTTKEVSLGDTVFIHFSCHGQQMVPLVYDSIYEPDMLDEALVPYDALKQWSLNYDGHNHIRDDELSKYINQIRDKVGVGGMVVVTLDACHSDSMQRGEEEDKNDTRIYRGTSDIFGDPAAITDSIIKNRFKRDTCTITINNNSHVVYLSACLAHSQNAEIVDKDGNGYGSLSYSIAKVLDNYTFADSTKFLDEVVAKMDSLVQYQTPGIRASFKYTIPIAYKKSTQKNIPNTESNKAGKGNNYVFIIVLATITICIVLLMRRKKK